MQLVEQHIIKYNNDFFREIDTLCFLSKNLYNSCLYEIRHEYINNKNNVIYELHHRMKNTEQYKALPAKVSSTILNTVQLNFKSFFAALKIYDAIPSKFNNRPNLPKYLDKVNGRFFISYTNQAISKKIFNKANKIKLSKTNIEFKTKIIDFNLINCVRIVPKFDYYVIEVVYTIKNKQPLMNNNRYIAIDLGVNNLATLTSNIKNINPLIINGKPLKSINQYYNKKKSKLRSMLETRNDRKTSKNLNKLELKRKNKIDNYLHKASKEIVKQCVINKINTLIIGKNNNWKQEANMGKVSNQLFINIPHSRFINMLKYKCEIGGINIIIQEESYTSKASFLNLDYMPVYGNSYKGNFSGYRYRRGIYKIRGKKIFINADVNGSYNILRKAIPNVFNNGIEGIGVCPNVITLKK
jgi:IS605 OrfB family transposase